MGISLTFHTRIWTVREVLLAQRLMRDGQDIEALVALLVSRSDASEETILALSVSELPALIDQLAEALRTAQVLGALSHEWHRHEHKGQDE